jgi:DNA-binding CsgD family transcriptional regulator
LDREQEKRLVYPALETECLFRPLGLTPRQCETLFWLVRGLRDREIARKMGVSPRTVEHHVSGVLQKLKVKTRAAAVRVAMEQKQAAATSIFLKF